ncbi:MAG: DEAD/DEAH box helicase, partial [Acidobacteriota bacterium]
RAKLIGAYERLPEVERQLVQLSSIIYEPVDKETFHGCVHEAGIRMPDGKPITIKALQTILSRLQNVQLLGEGYQCQESIVEVASRRAQASGRYGVMASAVQERIPSLYYYIFSKPKIYCLRTMRDFRISIYTKNSDLYESTLRKLSFSCPKYFENTDPIVRVCNNPWDADWFRTLPSSLQGLALTKIFRDNVARLEPDEEILAYGMDERFIKSLPEFERANYKYHLAARLVIGGRMSEAERILASPDLAFSAGLSAWITYLRGNTGEAIRRFDLDLKEFRKRSNKRSDYFYGISGPFFILALLESENPSAYKKVHSYINKGKSDEGGTESMEKIYTALDGVFHVLNSEPEAASSILSGLYLQDDALGFLFHALATFWVKGKLSRKMTELLMDRFASAREIGLKWLAMEFAELLHRSGKKSKLYGEYSEEVQKETGLVSVVARIRFEEPWRRGLRALSFLGESYREEAAKALGKKRMVWLVRYDTDLSELLLIPKEQTLTARGTWTEGRPVSYKRLSEGDKLDYLDERDQIIRAAVLDRFSYGAWGFGFNMETAVNALVGHPLLFLYDSPTTPVEFVRGEPELVVEQASQSAIVLKLVPDISETDSRFVIVRETPNRFRIIEPSDKHRRMARVLGGKGLRAPVSAREEVHSAIADVSSMVTVHSGIGGQAVDIESVETDSRVHVHLLPSGTGFRMELFVRPFSGAGGGPYLKPGAGARNVMAEVGGNRLQTERDLQAEEAGAREIEERCQGLSQYPETDRQWVLNDPSDCLQVLLDLKGLQESGSIVVEWPEGEKLRVTRQVSADQFHMKIRGKTDWFELSGQLRVDDNTVLDMKLLLDLVQQHPGRFIPIGEGQFLALTQEFRKRLDELNAYAEKRSKEVRLHPLAALALRGFTDQLANIEVDKAWKTRLERIEVGQNLNPVVPSNLKAELRDYQVDGYRWLSRLASFGAGACLADDMGLGKTLQALAVVLDRAPKGPTLVVAPTSVCMNWIDEANRFAPTLNTVLFRTGNREEIVKSRKEFDVLVCSYGLLHQESELLSSVEWETIVLDEAQAIKNVMTKRAQAAMGLRGRFKLITTGTPIENHLGELWNLFNFVNPGLLGTHNRFNERYATPIEKYGDRDSRKRLKKLIQPFILRRMKSQVLEELPPRTEVFLKVEMSEEEAAFYEAIRQKALERLQEIEAPTGQKHLQILAEITRLRLAACNPKLIAPGSELSSSKLQLFGDVVSELLENNHKALVFSQFVGHLSLIREYLDERKIPYRYLDGSTPPKERKREVDAFQSGEGSLFLISLKAGGLGLNLTAADFVIHMDPWWNPAVEDQASDRAHRIGQQRPVTVYRLVARDTIEEKIVR